MKRFLIALAILFTSTNTYAEQITADDVNLTVVPLFSAAPVDSGFYNSVITKITLPEGWYTYYANGGDTGLGANVDIKNLPQNSEIGEIYYPFPQKYIDKDIVSYIYKNEAYFAFNIKTKDPKQFPIKQGVSRLHGELEFLVCKDVCIPLSKDFTLQTIHSTDTNVNFVFPTLAKSVNFLDNYKIKDFTIKDKHLYIKLGETNDKLTSALFIPYEDGLINDMAEQTIVENNNTEFLRIPLDEFLEEKPEMIKGVIKTNLGETAFVAQFKDIAVLSFFDKASKFIGIALFALLGGIILNLMPCVLPVIGLKAYALVKEKSRTARLKGTLAYSAGVFVSMMIIVAVLVTLKALGNNLAWGFQLQNHYFVGFMVALLILVALNLLGLFNIGDKISNKASKLNMKHSSDFFTGVLTTFVATPCTAPFMATSLGFALSSDSYITTFVVFGFLALGICLPIVIISLLPKASKYLPKPGVWTEKLKQALAFPILATAVWLVWVLFGSGLYTDIAIVLFAASLIVWLYKFKSKYKFIAIVVTLLLSAALLFTKSTEYKSVEFSKQAIEQLNAEGKTVFVDFTAKWCLTCQFNKNAVIETSEVQDLLAEKGITYMVADWTNKDDNITQELQALERNGVPVYAFYKQDGSVVLLNEILTKDYLVESINSL
jgi:thiol:disulfide interchange protein DsbD